MAETDLKNKLADLEEQHAALVAAAQKMVRAPHGGAFIIPNGGSHRDRAIAAWDGLLAALGLKAGDLDGLSMPAEEQAENNEVCSICNLPRDRHEGEFHKFTTIQRVSL